MNTYVFYFSTDFQSDVSHSVKASRLSQALKIFYRESENFFYPVKILHSRYEITNSEGKCSSRLIPFKYFLDCPYRGISKMSQDISLPSDIFDGPTTFEVQDAIQS